LALPNGNISDLRKVVIIVAKTTLKIGGMACSACSAACERSLKRKNGVMNASVNAATGKGVVEYDPAVCKMADLAEAVESAGYTLEKEEDNKSDGFA